MTNERRVQLLGLWKYDKISTLEPPEYCLLPAKVSGRRAVRMDKNQWIRIFTNISE